MNTGINNLLKPEEKVVWQSVINRKMLGLSLFVILTITFAMGGFFLTQDSVGLSPCSSRYYGYHCDAANTYVGGSFLGVVIIVGGLALSFLNYFSQSVKKYIVTTKRVIIKSGLFRTNYKSIYFEQIKNVLIDFGLEGRIFGCGTVRIDTGEISPFVQKNIFNGEISEDRPVFVYDSLTYVAEPNEVYQYINSALASRKESLHSNSIEGHEI